MTKDLNKIDNNTITTIWADADLCSRCNKRSAKKEGLKQEEEETSK